MRRSVTSIPQIWKPVWQIPPSAELVTPENRNEYNIVLAAYQRDLSQDLLIVQQEKPEIFNRLMVKYDPDVAVSVDKNSLERQARIDADHNKTFEFSDYYKLTTLEMFNLLEGRAVYKTLKQYNFVDSEGNIVQGDNLKDRPELRQVSSKFDTWLKLNQQPNGSLAIEFVGGLRNVESQLIKFNFQDMDDANYVEKLAYHIRKGSEVVVKFPNASGTANLIVAANPPEGLKIANMDGKMLSPVPFLKVQPEKKNLSRPVVTSSNVRQMKNEESNQAVADNQPSQAQQHTGSQTNGVANDKGQSNSPGVLQQVRSFFARNRQVGENNNNGRKI